MPNMNLSDEEVALIQVIRAAKTAPDKCASQQVQFGPKLIKFHAYLVDIKLIVVRILTKKDDSA